MRCARLKWRFRLSLCPSWKGFCWLGYKTLNFNFSFFLSFFLFFLLGKTITCCFLKTHRLSFILTRRRAFKEEEDKVKEEDNNNEG